MGKVFLGLLFLAIDIKIGPMSITPNFIGYLLINYGMSRADGRAVELRKYRDLVMYFIPVGMIEFVLSVLGFLGSVSSVLLLAVRMVALWAVAAWSAGLEDQSEYDLGAEKITGAWKIICAINAVLAVIYLFPLFVRDEDMLSVLAVFAMVITVFGLIAMIRYLVAFGKFRKEWEEDIRERNEEEQ